MNIKTELLTDPRHSKLIAMRIATYACTSDAAFKELMHCFLSDDFRLAQRAAYSVSIGSKQKPAAIQPYIGVLVSQLKRTGIHDAVIRNSARVLEDISIPEEFHGELMDACFALVQNRQTAIAIRAFSLTILFNLCKIYPEIKNELRVIIEESMEFETPAFRSRGKKILKYIAV
ncbi:MAG: hypothetical protein ABIN80_02685 [Dyadobacter sp.]|uniref:hypothetical protein n=1 Tax=Dyadobacter sp. TaxID=1914288 RepID=UPI003266EFB2